VRDPVKAAKATWDETSNKHNGLDHSSAINQEASEEFSCRSHTKWK